MNDNFQIGIRNGVSWRLCDVGQLCRSRRAERHCRETGGSWCGRWGCGGWGSGKGIEAGDYTFRFTVEGGGGNSLWRISNRRSVFRLMQWAAWRRFYQWPGRKERFLRWYVNYSCGGSCDELDYYLDAWKYIIDHIISGQITESTLDSWLEYFDECYYQEETTVEKWHKTNWKWRIFHKMHRPFADMLDHSLCFPFANKV